MLRLKHSTGTAIVFLVLLVSKGLLKTVHLKRLQWIIGRPANNNAVKLFWNTRQLKNARLVGKYIFQTQKKVFWKTVCLDQALAAAILLRMLKTPFRLHFGLLKENGLQAHAWVSCGDMIVTGFHNNEKFHEVTVFYWNKKNLKINNLILN